MADREMKLIYREPDKPVEGTLLDWVLGLVLAYIIFGLIMGGCR